MKIVQLGSGLQVLVLALSRKTDGSASPQIFTYRPHEVIAKPLRHHSVDILSNALFSVWLPY